MLLARYKYIETYFVISKFQALTLFQLAKQVYRQNLHNATVFFPSIVNVVVNQKRRKKNTNETILWLFYERSD